MSSEPKMAASCQAQCSHSCGKVNIRVPSRFDRLGAGRLQKCVVLHMFAFIENVVACCSVGQDHFSCSHPYLSHVSHVAHWQLDLLVLQD